ncbi:MAG: GGDEF domain-containing protein [Lysinibacillus sp.]|nr:GGDEF domain-containing protein [Lysinibacillus sp.]
MNVKLHHLTSLESRIVNLYSDGKYAEAIEVAEELLHTAKEKQNTKAMMNAYLNLANCYYYLGEIETAFENILEYKMLCDEYGDDRDKFYLYHLSALIYEYEENYEDAKEATQHCIQLALELEMYYAASTSYNTYSYYLLQEEKYEEALEFALKALRLAVEHCPSEVLLQCHIYFHITSCHIAMNNLSKAEKIINDLEMNQYINNSLHNKAHFLLIKAELYRQKGDFEKALKLLNESYIIYSEHHDGAKIKKVLKAVSEIYELLGDYKKSYQSMKEYLKITEKRSSLRLSAKMRELDIKKSIKAIEKRANVDGLTGVYNRYFLETTCNNWLKEAKEVKKHICCIVVDIDSFKNINDTFGHLLGDEVIKEVGQACLNVANEDKENIIVGRYGGDEFVVIFKDYPSHSIIEKAKQLYNEITSVKVKYLNNEIKVTPSIGVVCTDSLPSAKKFTQLFRVADQALYMAKRQGKNQIVYLSKENCRLY